MAENTPKSPDLNPIENLWHELKEYPINGLHIEFPYIIIAIILSIIYCAIISLFPAFYIFVTFYLMWKLETTLRETEITQKSIVNCTGLQGFLDIPV